MTLFFLIKPYKSAYELKKRLKYQESEWVIKPNGLFRTADSEVHENTKRECNTFIWTKQTSTARGYLQYTLKLLLKYPWHLFHIIYSAS